MESSVTFYSSPAVTRSVSDSEDLTCGSDPFVVLRQWRAKMPGAAEAH